MNFVVSNVLPGLRRCLQKQPRLRAAWPRGCGVYAERAVSEVLGEKSFLVIETS